MNFSIYVLQTGTPVLVSASLVLLGIRGVILNVHDLYGVMFSSIFIAVRFCVLS